MWAQTDDPGIKNWGRWNGKQLKYDIMKYKILFFAVVTFLFNCTSSSNDKEKELLERENAVLKKELELKSKEENTNKISTSETVDAKYKQGVKFKSPNSSKGSELSKSGLQGVKIGVRVTDFIGKWRTEMKCIKSDCRNVRVGEVKIETWLISLDKKGLNVKVIDHTDTNNKYKGKYLNDTLFLEANVANGILDEITNIKANLVIVKDDPRNITVLTGERKVRSPEGCMITYEIITSRNNSLD